MMDDDLRDLMEELPAPLIPRFIEFVELIDAFCDENLDEEYKVLCRVMAAVVCANAPTAPRGKPGGWAAGIVYSIGRVNFLTDPSQTPHMTSAEIASGFGVSPATMASKAKIIREGLGLIPFHPDWCLPSKIGENPLAWFLEVDGLIIDVRMAPREVQVAAYEEGLIPYLPIDG